MNNRSGLSTIILYPFITIALATAILFVQLLPFIILGLFLIYGTIYQYEKRFNKDKFYKNEVAEYIREFRDHYLFVDKEYQTVLYALKKEKNLDDLNFDFSPKRLTDLDETQLDAMRWLVRQRLKKGILKYEELKKLTKMSSEEKITSLYEIQRLPI